ncbi:MAG: Gx transporter family protein [Firmicutes bacterium]|nr:Gx transporter family protein [Bacillota bacterium]
MSSQARSPRKADSRTRLLAISAMFAALALIFSYVEVLIPIPVPIPGIKLGLANLVILIAIYRMGFKYAFTINMVRIVAAGLLFSGVFGMIYSLAGGVLSIIVMYLLYRTDKFSMVGVSMAGGVCHNLGQLLTACLLLENTGILSYFSVLLFSGLISGIAIGILAYIIEKRLPAFTE